MAALGRILGSMLAALLTCAAAPAEAQPPLDRVGPAGGVRIDGLDVEEVPQLASGTPLNFMLFGTPGAVASLQIEGARRALPLRETERGVYEGTYTIEERDRIAPSASVVATLYRGADSATATLDEPLVLGTTPPYPPPALAEAAPPVTPGGAAAAGSRWPREGRRVPAPPRGMPVPTVEGRHVPPPPRGSPVPTMAAQSCADCAVVEWIRRVETDAGDVGVAGAITGGVLGAILGNQIGHGDSRAFARVVGAVGGALAGREFARSQGRAFRYDALLRRPDGTSQVYSYDHVPPFRAGDVVSLPAVRHAQASRAPSAYGLD